MNLTAAPTVKGAELATVITLVATVVAETVVYEYALYEVEFTPADKPESVYSANVVDVSALAK